MKLPKPGKDYFYVGVQIILFVVYVLPISLAKISYPEWLRYSGFFILGLGLILGAVALLQLNTNLSPFPTPVANGKLITNGAFAIARHPIYTAVVFSGVGYAIYQVSLFKLLITLLLLVLFYYKSIYEEKLLIEKFPAYTDYKKRTRRFI
ncbi:methyltransferase family protein [Marixanthomonas spongiae]|uniref:Isoprenylcysteine carboxylmethyltransferase family protein n=1 Tax=Marixanthomonas spongiae TaxID=2174845 RepID=A0A2U0HVC2_9FLAO|nr:isoprenylcysteine carboxylmethyltransferase family protein [Marixanthomonas spongiae]PVW12821.1 isoprenylcysteine carboxylmethyltransferase family protein [Marixanthomonas spongiae]